MKKNLPQEEYDAQQTKQFTGWWIPAWIVTMFEDGRISAIELVLLATIDGYCRRGKDKLGCYASNAYLAKKVCVRSVRSVQLMLHKLQDLKLIRVRWRNGRRHIFSLDSLR